MLACEVTGVDQVKVEFAAAGDWAPRSVPLSAVARRTFTALPSTHAEKLAGAVRPGVLMLNNDFLDGEVTAVDRGVVHVTSVTFGAKSIDRRRAAAAVVLRPVAPGTCAFVVQLADGSALRAKAVELSKDAIIVDDADLGRPSWSDAKDLAAEGIIAARRPDPWSVKLPQSRRFRCAERLRAFARIVPHSGTYEGQGCARTASPGSARRDVASAGIVPPSGSLRGAHRCRFPLTFGGLASSGSRIESFGPGRA